MDFDICEITSTEEHSHGWVVVVEFIFILTTSLQKFSILNLSKIWSLTNCNLDWN